MKQVHLNAENVVAGPSIKQQVESEKWFRIPMVWVMIGLPFIAVVASLTTVVIAYKNAPQIVSAQSSVPNSVSVKDESNH